MDVAAPRVRLRDSTSARYTTCVADFLSRIDNSDNALRQVDDFPDTDILRVATMVSREERNFLDRWLMDMSYFLTTGLPPPQLRTDEKKRLAIRSHNFCLVKGILYHKGSDGIWRCGIRQDEKEAVLREAHCGTTEGHYARKVWQAGLWWPTTQKDPYQYYKQGDLCQRLGQPTELARMPHQPLLLLDPFQKWGLDFVGPFMPAATRTGNKYIFVVTARNGSKRKPCGTIRWHPHKIFI